MTAASEVTVPLRNAEGAVPASLRIFLLPRSEALTPSPLLDERQTPEHDQSVPGVQLLEGVEYRYEWKVASGSIERLTADPEEVFQPDTADGARGRLRPGLATGTMQVQLRDGEFSIGRLELEVRSRKMDYLTEYRHMLRDIADEMTELVMERFAASEAQFEVDETRDASTLYQRFAFLRSVITSDAFQNAVAEILRRPHVAWDVLVEPVRPGEPMRGGSHLLRQFSRPGARVTREGGQAGAVPLKLERQRTVATHDTTPNRFVKFAFQRWRQIVADIQSGLATSTKTPAIERGLRETLQLLDHLEGLLHHELFREVGNLPRFPADDQVLQKREGYRDILRAYVELELAARLSWRPNAADYEAGQRDVATLYEYWAFIQLARTIADLVGKTFDMAPLVQKRPDGLNVVLQSGVETVLNGSVQRFGRRLNVELCFNRTFWPGRKEYSSWTRPMRPDYSLVVRAADDEPSFMEPVILHFDAKYKVTFLRELFGGEADLVDVEADAPERVSRGGALRVDLLKMHAYRDAIRRSAGAFILYPGGDSHLEQPTYPEYEELLPGLGAFVLRPTSTGDVAGSGALRRFLDEVLDHVATRMTQHERGRYWLEEVYGGGRPGLMQGVEVPSLQPRVDTSVLLGFVKSQAHWVWIKKRKTYNVRTEDRAGGVARNADLLNSQLALMYCPANGQCVLARLVSDPQLVEEQAMKASGYPRPRGAYWCVQISLLPRQEWIAHVRAEEIDRYVQSITSPRGRPVVLTWQDLMRLGGGGPAS